MAIRWEYVQVLAESDKSPGSSGAAKVQAAKRWIALLNQRGGEGWELVSEEFAAGGSAVAMDYWAQYAGVMKRPRD